jgi:hypothetical protein
MDRADPIDVYEAIDPIAERRASQQEDNNGLKEFRAGELVARGADDR